MKIYMVRDGYGHAIGVFDSEHINEFIRDNYDKIRINDIMSCELNSIGKDLSQFTGEDWDENGIID